MLASTEAQVIAATADVENARLTYTRMQDLAKRGVASLQELDQARTAFEAAQAKLDSLSGRSRRNARQSRWRARTRSRSRAPEPGRNEPAHAGRGRRAARQGGRPAPYTEITAPIDGIVDVRAARAGEYVSAGQPIVTLINPDDLWVRADVEETYIDRVRVGDKLTVRLPSGDERAGHRLLSRRRRGVCHAARRQPHQARHQDLRGPPARRQRGSAARRRHDGIRPPAGLDR